MLLHRVLSYALQHSWLASLATCAAMHSSTCGAKVLLLAQKESNSILHLLVGCYTYAHPLKSYLYEQKIDFKYYPPKLTTCSYFYEQ